MVAGGWWLKCNIVTLFPTIDRHARDTADFGEIRVLWIILAEKFLTMLPCHFEGVTLVRVRAPEPMRRVGLERKTKRGNPVTVRNLGIEHGASGAFRGIDAVIPIDEIVFGDW